MGKNGRPALIRTAQPKGGLLGFGTPAAASARSGGSSGTVSGKNSSGGSFLSGCSSGAATGRSFVSASSQGELHIQDEHQPQLQPKGYIAFRTLMGLLALFITITYSLYLLETPTLDAPAFFADSVKVVLPVVIICVLALVFAVRPAKPLYVSHLGAVGEYHGGEIGNNGGLAPVREPYMGAGPRLDSIVEVHPATDADLLGVGLPTLL
jgi:hypothetical protein